jgi:hypothetical protein
LAEPFVVLFVRGHYAWVTANKNIPCPHGARDEQGAGDADHRGVVGEDPTRSERRPISLFTSSSGLVEGSLVRCSAGEARRR